MCLWLCWSMLYYSSDCWKLVQWGSSDFQLSHEEVRGDEGGHDSDSPSCDTTDPDRDSHQRAHTLIRYSWGRKPSHTASDMLAFLAHAVKSHMNTFSCCLISWVTYSPCLSSLSLAHINTHTHTRSSDLSSDYFSDIMKSLLLPS